MSQFSQIETFVTLIPLELVTLQYLQVGDIISFGWR